MTSYKVKTDVTKRGQGRHKLEQRPNRIELRPYEAPFRSAGTAVQVAVQLRGPRALVRCGVTGSHARPREAKPRHTTLGINFEAPEHLTGTLGPLEAKPDSGKPSQITWESTSRPRSTYWRAGATGSQGRPRETKADHLASSFEALEYLTGALGPRPQARLTTGSQAGPLENQLRGLGAPQW